ncbi:hypothetical protein V1525DRAFT_459109 [Lipomyces kononenkoae]|uniref:Uncharacterized protein n=1 Tax=Lipomyces kononenkoae TaxID=34357 RepID=A0ACC3ST81_LIPKO
MMKPMNILPGYLPIRVWIILFVPIPLALPPANGLQLEHAFCFITSLYSRKNIRVSTLPRSILTNGQESMVTLVLTRTTMMRRRELRTCVWGRKSETSSATLSGIIGTRKHCNRGKYWIRSIN